MYSQPSTGPAIFGVRKPVKTRRQRTKKVIRKPPKTSYSGNLMVSFPVPWRKTMASKEKVLFIFDKKEDFNDFTRWLEQNERIFSTDTDEKMGDNMDEFYGQVVVWFYHMETYHEMFSKYTSYNI
jgi:hypothetical protein